MTQNTGARTQCSANQRSILQNNVEHCDEDAVFCKITQNAATRTQCTANQRGTLQRERSALPINAARDGRMWRAPFLSSRHVVEGATRIQGDGARVVNFACAVNQRRRGRPWRLPSKTTHDPKRPPARGSSDDSEAPHPNCDQQVFSSPSVQRGPAHARKKPPGGDAQTRSRCIDSAGR